MVQDVGKKGARENTNGESETVLGYIYCKIQVLSVKLRTRANSAKVTKANSFT